MLLNLALAYVLASSLGRDGAAISLIVVAWVMPADMLRQSLPAAHAMLSTRVRLAVHPSQRTAQIT